MLHPRQTFADVVYQAVTRFPERSAFVDERRVLTYRDCEHAIAACLEHLQSACRLSPGAGVAVLSGNRPETFFALAASALGSFRYTPLHPEASAADHAYVLEKSEASILLYDDQSFGNHVRQHAPGWPSELKCVALEEVPADDATEGTLRRPAHVDPAALCFVTFTGGTTGRPKGVCRSQRTQAVNAVYTALEWEWPSDIRFLIATPMSHATGTMVCPILLRGGLIVTQRRFDVPSFVANVARHEINATFIVPTMLYRLLDRQPRPDALLESLETVIYGASPVNTSRLEEAIRRFGPIFTQLYGQAEAPNLLTVLRKADHLAGAARLTTCGRPTGCAEVAILDEEGKRLPPGAVGEICARGEIVMDGYWKEPELTATTLRDGWLHTGDLGFEDKDGYFSIVDRAKDMIITGGLNVYAREVEDAIAAHPAVQESAVVGLPHPDWGEVVTAFVIRRPGCQVEADEIVEFVRERKGSVHAPKHVVFVDSLPVTPLGKHDKQALRDAQPEVAPDGAASHDTSMKGRP
jgi:fatty-acyl-CoA synthase